MAIRSLKTGTISRSALAGNALSYPGSYEAIGVVDVGSGGQSTITFSSIPSTYKHLQIRGIGRSTNADTQDNTYVRFNSDSGANYSWHYLGGDGSSRFASATSSTNQIISGRLSAANATANMFGTFVIDILDYTNTNKYKTTRTLTGVDLNGSGNVWLWSGNWRNTAAISTITLTTASSTNFAQNSSFSLYGIN